MRSASAAILALAVSSMWTSAALAAGGGPPGVTPVKKRAHERLSIGESRGTLDLKFAEGSDVRLRGGHLVSRTSGRIAALDSVLAAFPGVRVNRLFRSAGEEDLTDAGREARARSGRHQADLNLFFRLDLPAGTDIVALTDALNALDVVEVAAPAAKPESPPVTASFVGAQGYRTPAPSGGIDADFAQTLTGGKGENVSIVDVEYSWNRSHEDLSKARAADAAIPNGTACDPFAATLGAGSTDHGTAVLGEIGGDANGFGVTGLAPGAKLRTVNVARRDATGACVANVANSIAAASDASSPGDVLLIEQQLSGPRRTDPKSDVGYVPVEWDQSGAVRAAIQNATARGRIVVEAAGNGYQDLDDAVYNDPTGRNWFSYDSGAIMVGAGNAPGCTRWGPVAARGRLAFSNYGSRLNAQAWGACVTTTGYGFLQGATGSDLAYTDRFSGTSSASPIVASSAALLSSIAESRGTTLTPAQVRSLLSATGQAQPSGDSGRIGPLPDMRAAIGALGP
jgi:serine protease